MLGFWSHLRAASAAASLALLVYSPSNQYGELTLATLSSTKLDHAVRPPGTLAGYPLERKEKKKMKVKGVKVGELTPLVGPWAGSTSVEDSPDEAAAGGQDEAKTKERNTDIPRRSEMM
jgi:hypothetical protein